MQRVSAAMSPQRMELPEHGVPYTSTLSNSQTVSPVGEDALLGHALVQEEGRHALGQLLLPAQHRAHARPVLHPRFLPYARASLQDAHCSGQPLKSRAALAEMHSYWHIPASTPTTTGAHAVEACLGGCVEHVAQAKGIEA